MDEEKEEVRELVDFLKTPKKFADMGAKDPTWCFTCRLHQGQGKHYLLER